MPQVIISMTSIPSRNGTLGPTLESLHNQTLKPDEINLYIDNDVESPNDPFIKVNKETDLGPITKLSAVIDNRFSPETIIVTVDDDVIYEPTWLETLVKAAEENPDSAIGMSGWDIWGFLSGQGSYKFPSPPCDCDVLEGWAGIAYRKEFFEDDIFWISDKYKWVDDVWISSYLNYNNITRKLIRSPMAKSQGRWPGLHNRPDFLKLNLEAVISGFKGEGYDL